MTEETDLDTMSLDRRPTPAHDAAHVLVSFQHNGVSSDRLNAGSANSSKRRLQGQIMGGKNARPLSIANVHRPPQNRRRVWRACEPCRKKKTKCDGAEPCECCLDAGTDCIYAVEGYRRGFVDSQVVDAYGKRIQALEELVSTLVEEQHKLAAQISNGKRDGRDLNQRHVPDSLEFQPPSAVPETNSELPPLPGPVLDLGIVTPQSQPTELADMCPDSGVSGVPIPRKDEVNAPRVFTDDYGTLTANDTDGATYIGLGATVSMVGECGGVQSLIRQGLLQKEKCTQESIIDRYLFPKRSGPRVSVVGQHAEPLPPVPLMDTLIDAFFLKVYRLFPVIEADDFQRQYVALLSGNQPRPGFLVLLYSVLAAAAPHVSPKDPVWARDGCAAYQALNAGGHFYGLAIATGGSSSPFPIHSGQQHNNINTITALTLLGMHLTQLGMLGEAWNTVGQAVRLGYEMGLHRSPKRLGLPLIDVRRRCQLWWCLYVMDRLLSLHLGRPIAINDNDSDVLFPSARPQAPGFVAMTHLCRIIGRIQATVCSMQNISKWKDPINHPELQNKIQELWDDLQNWRNQMPSTSEADRTTERYVLMSSYCSAVHLLFRPFLPTPHRSLALDSPDPLRECFHAAIECIKSSDDWIRDIPLCHYYVFNGHNLFISVTTLLHCMRQTNDDEILSGAGHNAQRGIAVLSMMESAWPMARQYRLIAEEYQTFTKEIVDSGKQNQCVLDGASHPNLALPSTQPENFEPWKEFTTSIDLDSANLFPSIPDAGWMNELFQISPSSQGLMDTVAPLPLAPVEANDTEIIDEPTPKRRKVTNKGMNSVCAFTVKRSSRPS